MKKTRITLFAVLTCLLTGCGPRETTTMPSSVTPDSTPTSEQTSVSESVSSQNDSVSSEEVISSLPDSDTASSESDVQEKTPWNNDVVEVMKENLDQNVLPYVKLADNEKHVIAVFNDHTNEVEVSGMFTFSDALKDQYQQVLEDAGWITTTSENELKATLASKNLSLVFKATSEEEGNLACIYAKWNEAYDPQSFQAWPQECLDLFNYWLNDNGASIPLVYVGAKYPTASFNTSDRYIAVIGKIWQDDLVSKANTVLTASGWTILVDSESSVLHIGAHKMMQDGWEISLLLSQNIDGLPELDIFWTEAFQAPAQGAWNSETEDAIVDNLGLSVSDLPYLYLATVHETSEYNTHASRLRIHGGAFDSRILTDTTYGATAIYGSTNGWNNNMLSDEPTGEASSAFVATKTINGNEVTVKIYEDEEGAATMDIVSLPPFVAPANADWTASTKQTMQDHLGLVLPYVYLGTTSEKNYWEAATSRVLVVGSRYESVILTNAKATYEALDYTCTITHEYSDFTMTQEDIFRAKKTITRQDGSEVSLTVQIENTYQGPTLSAKLDQSGFSVPDDCTDWSQDVKDSMLTNLGHNDIPYVYLGTKTPTVSFDADTNELDLQGVGFDSQMISLAKTAFEAASWSDVYAYPTSFMAKKTYDNGDVLNVVIYASGNNVIMEIHLTPAAVDSGAWSEDTISDMEDALNGHTLPYVFIGSSDPEVMTDTDYIQIAGGAFEESYFTAATTAYEAAGYHTSITEDNYGLEAFHAYQRFDDGSAIVVVLQDYGDCTGIEAYFIPAETISNTGSYSTPVTFDCGYTLPFITTGSESNVSESFGSFVICGAEDEAYKNQYVFNAMDVLFQDNPNWEFTVSFDWSGNLSLDAVLDDPSLGYTVELTYEDDYGPEMSCYAEARETTGGDASEEGETSDSWTSEIQATMTSELGFVIPYFEMGSDVTCLGTSESYGIPGCLLSSSTYDADLLDSCADVFRNDTGHTWTVTIEEDDDYGCMMVKATTTDGDSTIEFRFYGFANDGMYAEITRE